MKEKAKEEQRITYLKQSDSSQNRSAKETISSFIRVVLYNTSMAGETLPSRSESLSFETTLSHNLRTLKDLDLHNKQVLLRSDIDVSMDAIDSSSALRLHAIKDSVDYCMNAGAQKIIIFGHVDRPPKHRYGDGTYNKLTTSRLKPLLTSILERNVEFMSLSEDSSTVLLLENLRFWKGEEANDPSFAAELASFGDVFINDSFASSHRSHSSTVGLAKLLPSAAGLHLEKEVSELSRILRDPQKPFVVVMGGSKVGDKASAIFNLARIADYVLVGGKLPEEIRRNGIALPENVKLANTTSDGFDIDKSSASMFTDIIKNAGTVVWNGAQGWFENGFTYGTDAVADAIVNTNARTIAGGGETIQYLAGRNLLHRFSFVSTGGGAMLEFLSGKELPGIEALKK